MNKTLLTLVLVIATLTNYAFAQQDDRAKALKERALKEVQNAPKGAYDEYFKTYHSRMPKEYNAKGVMPKTIGLNNNGSKAPLTVPQDMIYPGEFDEVQAIMMTWPYITFKTSNPQQQTEQLFAGKGPESNSSYNLVDVTSVPYVNANDDFVKVFAKLADGIQKNAQVWINIWAGEDSIAIKQYMTNIGTPLTNYRFFVNPGNSFWYRDCGPVGFYYDDDDKIGFMDFEYYGGRPLDDIIGKNIPQQAGYPVFTTTIEYEGGNILLDGLRSLFTSDAVYELNMNSQGLFVLNPSGTSFSIQNKQPLTKQQVRDSLTHLLNLDRCVVLPALRYDGGTGHIDLYADMVDECTFVSTKHPEQMANLSDPKKVEKNMDSITSMYADAPFSQKYYNTRIPLPAKNDGSWYATESEYHQFYTRSFSNHTFVNGAIMQPVFYATNSGDIEGNTAAINKMKEAYPGYDFVEIDVREFDGSGGAIHCITKQVPAENPVRIYHFPARWLNTTENNFNSVWITALAQNKSGIDNTKLSYRKKGETNWTEIAMGVYDGNIYHCHLPINPNVNADTIEYYISATSNNGKTMHKPFTAPKGYYTFIYGKNVNGNGDYIGIDCMEDIKNLSIGEFYPNPAQNMTKISIPQGAKTDIPVKVISVKGQIMASSIITKGQTEFEVNTSSMRSGNYYVIFGENTNIAIKKIIVVK